MNIYLTDFSPAKTARWTPEAVQFKRFDDAMELVSFGAKFWEDDEGIALSTEPYHAWSKWVIAKRNNWIWTINYLKELAEELDRRGKGPYKDFMAYVDYLAHQYGEHVFSISTPPRCIPRQYKREAKTTITCILAYRRYIRTHKELHAMGKHQPLWLLM